MSYFEQARKKVQDSQPVQAVTAIAKPIFQPIQNAAADAGGAVSDAAKAAAAKATQAAQAAAAQAAAAQKAAAAKAAAAQQAVASAGGAFSKAATDAWKATGGELDSTGQRPILKTAADISKWANIQGGATPNASAFAGISDVAHSAAQTAQQSANEKLFASAGAANIGNIGSGAGSGGTPGILGTIGDGLTKIGKAGTQVITGKKGNKKSPPPGQGELPDDHNSGAFTNTLTNPVNVVAPGAPQAAQIAKDIGGQTGADIGNNPLGNTITKDSALPANVVNGTNGNGTSSSSNGLGGDDTRPQPSFDSLRDANGNLLPQFKQAAQPAITAQQVGPAAQQQIGAVSADQRGINALRDYATGTGDSAWAGLQKQKQALDESTAIDNTAKSSAGAIAGAQSGLAMHGGLRTGAAARLALQGANQSAAALQGVRTTGMGNRLDIGIADQQGRMDALKTLPTQDLAMAGLDLDKAKSIVGAQTTDADRTLKADTTTTANNMTVDQNNIGNAVGDVGAGNAFKQFKYGQDTSAWAANKTADAISKGGTKSILGG